MRYVPDMSAPPGPHRLAGGLARRFAATRLAADPPASRPSYNAKKHACQGHQRMTQRPTSSEHQLDYPSRPYKTRRSIRWAPLLAALLIATSVWWGLAVALTGLFFDLRPKAQLEVLAEWVVVIS